jgi:hypothetical protein
MRTLIDIGFDGERPFNQSPEPIGLTTAGASIKPTGGDAFALQATSRIRLDRPLADLAEFTIEARVTPQRSRGRQVLIGSDAPPLRVELDRSGVVTAAVHTADGWQSVTADRALPAGKESLLRVSRSTRGGTLRVEIDGKEAGATAAGELVATGRAAMSIGTDTAGKNGFIGALAGLRIVDTVVTAGTQKALATKAAQLKQRFVDRFGVDVSIYVEPGQVDGRFAQIKSIMRAAGVDDLASLSTLTIQRHTALSPGSILKAPAAGSGPLINWGSIATQVAQVATLNPTEAKRLIDTTLLTSSVSAETALTVTQPVTTLPTLQPTLPDRLSSFASRIEPLQPLQPTTTITAQPVVGPIGGIGGEGRIGGLGGLQPVTPLGPGDVADGNGSSPPSDTPTRIVPDRILTAIEAVERLRRDEPWQWPITDVEPIMIMSNVLPVNSAVIIARRLDLTNQTLEIDPAVGTLYIIAEEIEAATGAAITWKRPALDVPNIGPDPALDGQPNWSGVHTASGSKHGLPGGDARSGANGIGGRAGHDAPNVEIWALRAHGMPDIDLEGQTGGTGGRGQQGGRGGRGAEGKAGEWYWFFGRQCWSDPGNGGDGGRGGSGGAGGPGGVGGDGGDILFAVLEETIEDLVAANAFTPDLGPGPGGDGGDGGLRGEGGMGGARGFTEVCDGGRAGAQGQPGVTGPVGGDAGPGIAGQMRIMTITEEAWNEQLTRPWLYDVTPDASLPGGTVVLKGTRFADTDQVRIGSTVLSATLRADEGLDVTVPTTLAGGTHQLYLRRHDGQESNRLPLVVRPMITGSLPVVTPGAPTTVDGRAFVTGATVDYAGAVYPATVASATRLTFVVPAEAGTANAEREVSLTVVNPDGQRSNTVLSRVPQMLRNGFTLGVHDFSFANDADGRPSWSTFEDTYGGVEVWHELLDPIFGHPLLTAAYFIFYQEFLKGQDNGGLATGFCTSLASMALDRFWTGHNDTFTSIVRDDAFRHQMTAIHGRLLSRESLLSFHDQGRNGQANVVTSFRRIEAAFATGGTRETAPMLFFVPDGAAWDAGYFDQLAASHCIVPIRIIYPIGYDGSSLDGVRVDCWDNNHPDDADCFVVLRTVGTETRFTYTAAGSVLFTSEDDITLATATLGEYLLRDLDLPFSGPFGLTTFVLDFLLSPATLQVIDEAGRVTGHAGGQILSEIPNSHPAYLVPNAFLLPTATGLTRRITGIANATYSYASLAPAGTSIGLTDVPTSVGEVDRVMTSADAAHVRFAPAVPKSGAFTMARRVSGHARGISVERFSAGPGQELDVTAAPDMSLVRVSNPGAARNVDLRLLDFDPATEGRASLARTNLDIPAGHDLVVAVTDWPNLADTVVTTTVVSTGP